MKGNILKKKKKKINLLDLSDKTKYLGENRYFYNYLHATIDISAKLYKSHQEKLYVDYTRLKL